MRTESTIGPLLRTLRFVSYVGCAALLAIAALGAPDLYIKDCPADTGAEPNVACAVYYLSEDIWVRQNPISGYQFAPFTADPAWLTAVVPLHQNPEYRDPKFSKPNYVYIRVRNRGSTTLACLLGKGFHA